MTLIVLGHELSSKDAFSDYVVNDLLGDIRSRGLFAVADSALTSRVKSENEKTKYRTLLTGLRKIHPVQIRVGRPDLSPCGSFQGRYFETAYKSEAFVAFAGSASSAHHALNSIRTHLDNLRLSFRFRGKPGEPTGNILVRHCQNNPMDGNSNEYGDDTFLGDRVDHLFNAEAFAGVVAYSIQESLQSAVRYCGSESEFTDAMATFAFGTWCPVSREHRLYHLEPKREFVGGELKLIVLPRLVPDNQPLVLGTKSVVETLSVQNVFDTAVAADKSPSLALLNLVDSVVDMQNDAFTGYPINRPVVLKKFKEGSLKLDKIRGDRSEQL